MTTEEKVKAKWPDAYAEKLAGTWFVWSCRNDYTAEHVSHNNTSEAAAWADAARRIEEANGE